MSVYTATEILLWLALATVLGFALGYLVGQGRRHGEARADVTAPVDVPAAAVPSGRGPTATSVSESSDPIDREPVAMTRRTSPDRRPVGAGMNRAAFRGSAMPGPGGGQPAADYEIKANIDSMSYYVPGTDAHQRVTADVWFRDAATAEAAGFRPGQI